MKVKVFAKLNLTLAVGKKQGKFHKIDSVVTSVDMFDTVEMKPATAMNIVHCDAVPQRSNIALIAANTFCRQFGTPPVEITIEKGIPIGAGLGGSSADAAAVIFCMCKFFGIKVDDKRIRHLCSRLGSDVSFMLKGGMARMGGKGDELTFLPERPLWFALTLFDKKLSTAQVYRAFDELPAPMPHTESDGCFNDLQAAAQSFGNYAAQYIAFTRKCGYKCCMTGSGSAFFVPFERQEDAVAATERLNGEGFFTRLTHTVPCGVKQI